MAVARNRYSVPCELAGQMVSTRLYPARVVVVAGDAVVAESRAPERRGQDALRLAALHPAAADASPARCATARRSPTCPSRCSGCAEALLRDPGGDRVMAQVLAIVPSAGLEAVLVAVELALESGPPSGRVSAEHVINVLARLNAAPAPENAATPLQVADAAAGRHGALRQPARERQRRGGRPCVTCRWNSSSLRLHGMAGAWADLVEQGASAELEARAG